MPRSDEAIRIRDSMNRLIQQVQGEDEQTTEIIRCCIAVGVEALEEWLYDGKSTPSVAPLADIIGEDPLNLQLRMPKHWTDAEQEHFGMGRKVQFIKAVRAVVGKDNVSLQDAKAYSERVIERYPELYRAKLKDLSYRAPEHWGADEKEAFKHGRMIDFIKAVRTQTGVGLKDGKAYFEKMKDEHADMWAIDTNGLT